MRDEITKTDDAQTSRSSVCIVAGEASGDAQGSLLVKALKHELPSVSFWGAAGPLLRQEGVETVVRIEDLAVLGLFEVISQYPTISKCYKKLLAEIKNRRPLAVIFIDYPGFNLKLIQDVYALGMTTVYHIPPKAWSHGENRTEILRNCAYLVTSVLPFEKDFFAEQKVPVQFIGNPLKDHIDDYIAAHGNKKEPYKIGIFPGSRKGEIQRLLPTLIQAFIELHKIENKVTAHIPIAQTLSQDFVKEIINTTAAQNHVSQDWVDQHIHVSFGNAYDVMSSCSYAWVCSGTATLETALFGTPMSSFYKFSPLTYLVAKIVVTKIKYFTLVNLCADKLVIPEFLQNEVTPENLVGHALQILNDAQARENMVSELNKIRDLFPKNAAQNAAKSIAECILNFNLPIAEKFHAHANLSMS